MTDQPTSRETADLLQQSEEVIARLEHAVARRRLLQLEIVERLEGALAVTRVEVGVIARLERALAAARELLNQGTMLPLGRLPEALSQLEPAVGIRQHLGLEVLDTYQDAVATNAELTSKQLRELERILHLHRYALAALASPIAFDNMRVSIYLADEGIHEQVETAVEQWLAAADVSIRLRAEPVVGSWFRRMEANVKRAVSTPAGREALLTATHIVDSRLVQSQDAYVTATLLQNVGPVLQALQPTKDAVVRAGALLIVKLDWVVQVHQLTAAQQAMLDHQPQLAASPKEIIIALQASEPELAETAQ